MRLVVPFIRNDLNRTNICVKCEQSENIERSRERSVRSNFSAVGKFVRVNGAPLSLTRVELLDIV